MKIAIVFGSSMGNTENAANLVKEKLGIELDVLNVADIDAKTLNEYDKLICGTSTWNAGDMQDDWDEFNFEALDLSGKTIAVFGVGDSDAYADEFCDGMAKLYHKLKEAGGNMVGAVSADGYSFEESEAIDENGDFVGLPLDYDNEEEKNDERISLWIEQIKEYFV
ncbi:flavodoxin [Campylobacter blaseri]|uniref:Flavodoxin n=1 Tax=Campylobacter blaseri TaxID=2042961 RepID=A0A2P8QZF8_9BACT|nr:flavodoxin FldA [Campylobacter blaseri]PSM51629.1 flavodoxin [Campylobacter blaseri]PSM53422.1 flavodoxin [Campylobacter blaseri]QKF86718.1 flavodoxin [Campylobacter blaseri]